MGWQSRRNAPRSNTVTSRTLPAALPVQGLSEAVLHLPLSASRFSLFSHLRLPFLPCHPMLGSHLQTTPRRQHYLLPTAGKRERETSWGFIRGQATAARGAAMPAAPPDPAQVKEIRETSISRAQRQNPAFAFESIIYSSCFIIAEPSIDGGLWRGHSWSNNNNNKKYLSRRRILYEFIIRQGDAFFLAKVLQRK